MAETVKYPPAMRETWVRSLGWEDPLEQGMATHSSFLAWRVPRTEEPGRLQPVGHKESDTTERLSTAEQKPPQQEQVLKIKLFVHTHPAGSVSQEKTNTGM